MRSVDGRLSRDLFGDLWSSRRVAAVVPARRCGVYQGGFWTGSLLRRGWVRAHEAPQVAAPSPVPRPCKWCWRMRRADAAVAQNLQVNEGTLGKLGQTCRHGLGRECERRRAACRPQRALPKTGQRWPQKPGFTDLTGPLMAEGLRRPWTASALIPRDRSWSRFLATDRRRGRANRDPPYARAC